MDQNCKKKLGIIKDLIKKQQYKDALQQTQIIMYKYSKVFQVHLMAGLCYEKLGKYKQSQAAYLQVLDLKPGEVNAIKCLCDLYTKIGDVEKSTKYLQSIIAIQKTTEPLKYRQNLVKLVKIHEKNENMQKIDVIFKQLLQNQNQITQQLAQIAESYFKTGVTNKCFYLNQFLPLGLRGDHHRALQPSAKQKLNELLIQIVRYLYSVKLQYKMSSQDISTSIYQIKQCFSHASCMLMLYLLDDFCISQTIFNCYILQEIYLFLKAFYDKEDNCYKNIQTLQPEIFLVTAILSYEYLAFMKQFFILDQSFNPYYDKLQSQVPQFQTRKIRQQYSLKIQNFILRECRAISKITQTHNIQDRLQSLKYRIVKLDRSYLEEVVAKMAMNCFVSLQKLTDMKDLLKTRINNLTEGSVQPHLYKYYYDYLIKIAKLFKSLDEQISIYDVIEYIKTNDLKDYKYLIQYYWIAVGKASKSQNFQPTIRDSIKNIAELLPKVTGSLKSQTIRKHTVLKIAVQQYEELLDGLKLALGTDRSFQNLQSMGLYYFIEGDYERGLRFLKQAFVIKQDQYHLNRAIFVGMIKTKQYKQAYSFLQRIYQGFPNVYWINYTLAINSINTRKFQLAYKYLSTALQALTSGIAKKYKFSYEKTIQGNKYSLLYMIDQNNFQILFDYFVIPEKKIYELFPMASSLFFDSDKELKQIRLETQLGQILKLLGRNKSSYNHLASAHMMLTELPEQKRQNNLLQVIVTKKQFATMLFYVRAYKQAQQLFRQTLKICSRPECNKQIEKDLLIAYQSQINSLLFQVSVMRLDQLMKFQSYQAVEQYVNKFHDSLKEIESLVLRPSLNYYKAKYQFYILCYLHNKNLGVDKSIETIREFLAYFGLDVGAIQSDKFYNRLVQLKNQQRIIVKQCLQDYYVLLYMKQQNKNPNEKIIAQNIFPLIQLFPTSSVFYIVYGMAVQQTKLKIASFLKCIQLDRQSPISVDLLASLFLKQKDYLTACKLFLKSLEIDLFNPKSFIGLCTCLYVLIGNSIKRGEPEDKAIIRKALNKINSYMQFLRIVDPSQNYHMLKFLKTLISDEPIPLFELKAGLEQSRKLTAHKYSQKLLYSLLQSSTTYLKSFNIWKQQGQQQVLKKYLQTNALDPNNDLYQIGTELLHRLQKQINEAKLDQIRSREIVIKIKCKMLNKLCICGNVFAKVQRFGQDNIDKFVNICELLQQKIENIDQQLRKLQRTAKQVLISSIIKSQNRTQSNVTKTLQQIKQINLFKVFKNNPTFSHIQVYLDHFEREAYLPALKRYIFMNIHCFPCDPILRKALLSWILVIEKHNNKINKKIKSVVDYRLESVFSMNSDQQANNMERHHKKFALMYNIQQPNAWVGYISQQWKRRRQPIWIEHLKKLLTKYSNKQNILSVDSRKKAECLLIQMSAQALLRKQVVKLQKQGQQTQKSIKSLHKVFQITNNNQNKKSLTPLIKQSIETSQINLMKYIIPHIVYKYQHSQQIQQIIDKCIELSPQAQAKGYFHLMKFISICSKPSKNQQQLVQQLQKLLQIIATSESHPSDTKIHSNAIAVMKCIVAMLSLNYQQLEMELNYAYVSNRFSAYSDQALINYFEVMKVYREVELNHQGENVFENFLEFVNGMIGFVKEPELKGFFFGLKAMAGAIVGQEAASTLSRQFRYAMLLAPGSGKQMLKSSKK